MIRFADNSIILLTQRLLLPAPLRRTMHLKQYAHLGLFRQIWQFTRQAVAHHSQYPSKFSASIALGVFFGIVPLWGVQMFVASLVAHVLGLSKTIVVAASNVSFPAMIPFVIYASLLVGHFLRTGGMKDLPDVSHLSPHFLLQSLGEYVLGSIVLALAAGAVSFAFTYCSVIAFRLAHRQWRRRTGGPARRTGSTTLSQ
jgi:uncharacterized protein (DUF2062 family)